jgi:hypothetical protein
MRKTLAALAFALALTTCLVAGPPKPWFSCRTGPWDELFEVTSVRHDAAKNQIVWELVATKAGEVGEYKALLSDADGVGAGTLPVKFEPAGKKVKARAKVRAVVALEGLGKDDFSRVTIRAAAP